MGISPRAVAVDDTEVFIPDIKAADVADFAVNDGKLAVVAVIQAHHEARQEGGGIAPCGVKLIKEILRQTGVADAVIKNSHLDPLCCLFRQFIQKTRAEPVPTPDVIFQMDIFLGIADILHEGFKFILAVIEIFDFIVKGNPVAAVQMQMCQIGDIFCMGQLALIFDKCLLLGDFLRRMDILKEVFIIDLLIIFFLFAKHFFALTVAPEDHIGKKAENRDEQQHQKPCPCAGRVSALEEHDEPGKDDVGNQQDDDKKKNPAPFCTHSQTSFFRFLSDEGCGRKYLSPQRGFHTQSIVYYIRLLCCKIGDDEKNRKKS